MRLALVLGLAIVVGCAPPARHDVDPVTMDEAKAFAVTFGTAAQPCDVEKVAALIDTEAIKAKLSQAAHAGNSKVAATLLDGRVAARILCSWNNSAETYHVLHVLAKNGEPRVVMRRLAREPRKKIVIVGYDELELGKSREDHIVRITDLYSVSSGETLSALLAEGMDALSAEGIAAAFDATDALKAVRALQKEGKFAEALAKLDALPPGVRQTRMIELARVRLAEAISPEAYRQAVEEMMTRFPDDPSVAQIAIDAALLRGDYDAALANIDIVDRAVGGDAFQDAVRAEVLRKKGDLDRAAERAEAAVTTEPTLAKGWYARLDVAVARKDYTRAFSSIERLREHFHAKLDDAKLRTVPSYADFVASPEYAAWLRGQ